MIFEPVHGRPGLYVLSSEREDPSEVFHSFSYGLVSDFELEREYDEHDAITSSLGCGADNAREAKP